MPLFRTLVDALPVRGTAVLVGALLSLPVGASAVTPDESDAAAIMDAVHQRDDGNKIVARMKIVVEDADGRTRERVAQSRSLDFDGGTKHLILFESPAEVRNTGLLSTDYFDGGKEDDQWLYLPSLRKSTRITAGAKADPFMDTDLSYSDLTRPDPSHYTYTLVEQSTDLGGEDCWLIEARPQTAEAETETGYAKSRLWVSKEKLMPVRTKHWLSGSKKVKQIKFTRIKAVDGVWVPHNIVAQTKRGKKVVSTTKILFTSYKTNQPSVVDGDFNQRRLEKGL